MIPKRFVSPGLLFVEYVDDIKRHKLVAVLDTTLDGIDADKIADKFMKNGTVECPAELVQEIGGDK